MSPFILSDLTRLHKLTAGQPTSHRHDQDAYLRPDQRGDLSGVYRVGLLLIRKGRSTGALEALQRAPERGSGEVADTANAATLGLIATNGEP